MMRKPVQLADLPMVPQDRKGGTMPRRQQAAPYFVEGSMTYCLPFVSFFLLATFVCLVLPGRSMAEPTSAEAARCEQLIDYYDRYGAGRSPHSDGRRNMTRIAASIDCERGDYARGIAEMEALLLARKFTIPPAGN